MRRNSSASCWNVRASIATGAAAGAPFISSGSSPAGSNLWAATAFARASSAVTLAADPKPISRCLPLIRYKNVQRRPPPLEMKVAPAAAPVAIEARTFQQDADEILHIRCAPLKPSSRRYWLYTFGRYPELLQKAVAEVSEADILTALAPRTDEGKKRAFWIFRKIPAWSQDQKHITTNPLGFKLESKLPLPRTPTDKHLPAMPFGNVPAFMSKLREDDMLASLCIQWIILTGSRSTEARDARWSEIDEKAGLWSIPASRMKQSRNPVGPLSSQALALLARLPRSLSRLFPGREAGTPMRPLPLYQL